MFEIPVRRHLANSSSPSLPVSATITGHHMEHTARLGNPNVGMTLITQEIWHRTKKMSAVVPAKTGEKILFKLPQVICLGWFTYRSRSTRKCVSNLSQRSKCSYKLGRQGRDETGVQIHWQIDRVLSWLQSSGNTSGTRYSSIARYAGAQEMVREVEKEHTSICLSMTACLCFPLSAVNITSSSFLQVPNSSHLNLKTL